MSKISYLIFQVLILQILCVEDGFIYLDIKYNAEEGYFTIPVYYGENDKIFEVQVDTTTSVSWIPSEKFPLDVKKYDISDSSSGVITKSNLEIEDEDGTVFGKVCYDSVKLGRFKINNFGFVLADEVDNKFKDYPQGKLGLGFRPENGDKFNIVKSFKKQGIISRAEFMISRHYNNLFIGNLTFVNLLFKKIKNSECKLIETNNLEFEYRNTWACLLSSFFFNINYELINGILNNVYYNDKMDVNSIVIFDSAFKYISFPKTYLNFFIDYFIVGQLENSCKQIKDEDSEYFICSDITLIQKTKIHFLINDVVYTLFDNNLFIKNKDNEYELLIRFYKEKDNIFTFGAPFLKTFSVLYSYEDSKISFYGNNINTYDDIYNIVEEQVNDEAIKAFKLIAYILIVFICLALLVCISNCCFEKCGICWKI